MKQQILSRSRLEPVMQKFGIYKDELSKSPMEDLIDRMPPTSRSMSFVEPKRDRRPGFTSALPLIIRKWHRMSAPKGNCAI